MNWDILRSSKLQMKKQRVFSTRMRGSATSRACARRGTGLWNITQPNLGGLSAITKYWNSNSVNSCLLFEIVHPFSLVSSPLRPVSSMRILWYVYSTKVPWKILTSNSQGLPRRPLPPQMPRKGGPIEKRSIVNVEKVLAVASGKGGVGKSTVASSTHSIWFVSHFN